MTEITKTGGQAIAVRADVSKSANVDRLFVETKTAYGELNIVVNNAGLYKIRTARFDHGGGVPPAVEYKRAWAADGYSRITQVFRPGRRERDQYRLRVLPDVLTGSVDLRPSKAELDAITGVLAKELAPRRIRVNSVLPGATLSEGAQSAGVLGVGGDVEKHLIAMTPLGRLGMPSDIAKVVVFLASDDSGWLTGEFNLASGGLR